MDNSIEVSAPQTLRAEIEAIGRIKKHGEQILRLDPVVEEVLPVVFSNADNTAPKEKSADWKSVLKAVLPGVGFLVGGPVGALVGATLGGATWSVVSAAARAGVIPDEHAKSIKRLRQTRNSILHEIDGVQKISKKEIREIVAGVKDFLEWCYNNGFLDPELPIDQQVVKQISHSDLGKSHDEEICEGFPEYEEGTAASNNAGAGEDKKIRRFLVRSLLGSLTSVVSVIHFQGAVFSKQKSRMGKRSLLKEATEGDELAKPQKDSMLESPSELVARKNNNVEKLKDLLQKHLRDKARENLIRKLQEERDYKGRDEHILCEYCLEDDPLEILNQEFGYDDLREIAQEYCISTKNISKTDLSRAILRCLGFSVPEPPKGINYALNSIKSCHKKFVRAGSKDEIIRLITPVAQEIERILHGLIGFYGTVFYGHDYKSTLAKWNAQLGQKTQTMGAQFSILKKMDKEFGKDPVRLEKVRALFGGREKVFGKELNDFSDIVVFRNKFLHFRDKGSDMGFPEFRLEAKEFFEKTLRFMEYLKENELYPKTVIVSGRHEDAYMRRWVDCTTESGDNEKVFTEEQLKRNAFYFMHPLTNPVRIYPIMVPYQEAG